MNIGDLFENAPNINVDSIMTDSRKPSENAIFFCIKGMVNDGHDFIEEAVANGAVCVVHSRQLDNYLPNVTYLMVKDTNQALNNFTARFYENASKNLTVFGITGTNGKSTIAWIIHEVLSHYEKCGYIGTIGIMEGDDEIIESPLVTPDTVFLHRTLCEMVHKGCEAVALEVSSIGIEEHRVDSIDFDFIGFSNLEAEHIDYHGNMENYYNAKRKLFMTDSKKVTAVINIDDPYGARLMQEASCRRFSVAVNQLADYRAVNVRMYGDHTEFSVMHNGKAYPFVTNLLADFNVTNALIAIAELHLSGIGFEEIADRLKEMQPIVGRMEAIRSIQPFNIVIDYAQSPQTMEKVFRFAKNITPEKNKIIALFGAPGSRARNKRVLLGETADKYCSNIILTTDDPRQEKPEDIAAEIKKGIVNAKTVYMGDRYNAVRQAIELANPNDTVLLLGKGTEKFLWQGNVKMPYKGDKETALEIINELYQEEEEFYAD